MIRYGWLVSGILGLAFFLTGCSATKNMAPPVKVSRGPAAGYVYINQIEQLDPQMPILISVDRAIQSDETFASMRGQIPVDDSAETYMNKIAALGNVGVKGDFRQKQQENLAAAGLVTLAELDRRLAASDEAQLDSIRSERIAQGDIAFQSLVNEIENQASTASAEDLADWHRLVNLRLQLAALHLDENPPPTAPRGYWAKLQATRESELNSLLGVFTAKMNSIYKMRDDEIAQERLKINSEIESDMASANSSVLARRSQIIEQAEQRLRVEQVNLKSEDDIVFRDAETVIDRPLDENLQSGTVEQVLGQANTSGETSELLLRKYQSKLEASILADAYATVTSISNDLHLKIVREKEGVPNVTSLVIESIKDRTWKVT